MGLVFKFEMGAVEKYFQIYSRIEKSQCVYMKILGRIY